MLEQELAKLNANIEKMNDLLAAQLKGMIPATLSTTTEEAPTKAADTPTEETSKKRGRPRKAAVKEEKKPEPEQMNEDEDDFLLDEEEEVESSEIDEETLRNKLKELRDIDKAAVLSLMRKYKAKAFSDIKESDYVAIYGEAQELING